MGNHPHRCDVVDSDDRKTVALVETSMPPVKIRNLGVP